MSLTTVSGQNAHGRDPGGWHLPSGNGEIRGEVTGEPHQLTLRRECAQRPGGFHDLSPCPADLVGDRAEHPVVDDA